MFDPYKNLFVFGYANGWTLWHLNTEDRLKDVLSPGWFAPAGGLRLRRGDQIHVTAVDGHAWLAVDHATPDNVAILPLSTALSPHRTAPPVPVESKAAE
ncbi:MAG: hypothetical protein HY057_10795 [Rhodospirillales bacterium]|nr:hypothetical protein [Rhodospirillales bacterium]